MNSVSPIKADHRAGLRTAVSRSALRLQSDRRLVALTRGGSGTAFSVIVERYRDPLLAYARRLVGPDEAEDVLQQTFANALGALGRDDRAIDVRPWLYRIAHNVAVNAMRRSGRHYEQLDEQYDGVPQPPDVLDQKLRIERLVDSIGRLPERQREAIVAHELEGRSYDEIAHSMSATTPIVRQLVHRARTGLRDACGVLVPGWALRWLVVADLRTAGSERVGEAVAGGATGAGLLKAGTALLATGAIATGAGGLAGRPAHLPGQAHAGPPQTQAEVRTAPEHESSAAQLPIHHPAAHDRRLGSGKPRRQGRRGGLSRGTQGPSRAHEGGDRSGGGHAQRPHHDGAAGPDGSGDSGAADTQKPSRDGSGDGHGDASPRGGDSHADGSGDSHRSPEGPDAVESSGTPGPSPGPPPPIEP